MDSTQKLLVIIASTRPGRVGKPVGDWITSVAEAHPGFEVTVGDLAEINLPLMNEPHHPRLRQYTHEHTKRWSALVEPQDAFVVVMPEYNHGMAPALVNAITYLVQEWQQKPVGIVSYGGLSAGMRATQQFKQIAVALGMMPVPAAVNLPFVSQSVTDGVFMPNDSASRSAEAMLDALWRWSVALKPLRTGEIPAKPVAAEVAAAR